MKIGDKVEYWLNGLKWQGIILDIFENGDIRTNLDGIRENGTYTMIREELCAMKGK
jgi:hypothetical protein